MTEQAFNFATPDSSMLANISWAPAGRRPTSSLLATFNTGAQYIYFAVPYEVAKALLDKYLAGESVGSAFNRLVKQGPYKSDRYSNA
jgi:hypothetical protein